jgi:hypothetical protein
MIEEILYCPIHERVKPDCLCPSIHSIGFVEYTDND